MSGGLTSRRTVSHYTCPTLLSTVDGFSVVSDVVVAAIRNVPIRVTLSKAHCRSTLHSLRVIARDGTMS